jgi:hypothetical protein
LAHGGKLKYCGNLPYYFNPGKFRYFGKLLQNFYNIGPWWYKMAKKYLHPGDLISEWSTIRLVSTANIKLG